MREIKFRAWDKERKAMWHNQFCITSYGHIQRSEPTREWHSWWDEDWVLMQYTGWKDKNGKEIYEGDVVFIDDMGSGGIVVFDDKWAGWCLDFGDDFDRFVEFTPPRDRDTNVLHGEVIGNIYENPELMSKIDRRR